MRILSLPKPDSEKHPSKVPHSALSFFETSSSEHTDLARDWLKLCSSKHFECNKRDSKFAPTRLLYVGTETENSSLHLHVTQRRKKQLKYCCLSHCWGGVSDIPLLKQDTIAQFRKGIDITSLPRSFQDAILITRQLEIGYLWIDSLCIIQDSPDDWAREAAVMGKIYENGYCTIAAAEAQNSYQGCFVRRNPLTCNAVRIASLADSELLLEPPSENDFAFASSDDKLSPYVIWQSTLPSRGWVFQEALLSPRILYFGRALFWTCRQGQASELDPLGRGLTTHGMMYGPKKNAIFHRNFRTFARSQNIDFMTGIFDMYFRGREPGGNAPGRHEYDSIQALLTQRTPGTLDYQFHKEWMRLLTIYTKLRLTMTKDRLIALSGIVQTIKRLVNSKYYAGLWEFTLPMDLVWTTGIECYPRPIVYRAPSWSWASIDGEIGSNFITMTESERNQIEVLIRIISVTTKCHPADVSCTGEVFDAVLVIVGILFQYKLVEKNYENEWKLSDNEGNIVGTLTVDTEPSEVSDKVVVLPVIRAPRDSYNRILEKLCIHGLGLVERDGYFERVGYYSFESSRVSGLNALFASWL
jgi:hypothetical protein